MDSVSNKLAKIIEHGALDEPGRVDLDLDLEVSEIYSMPRALHRGYWLDRCAAAYILSEVCVSTITKRKHERRQ